MSKRAAKTICLNMIVKNEARIIERALSSAKDHIDYWVICDTGSSDGTQDIIRRFFAAHHVPGLLLQLPWVDFGHSRTEAIRAARGTADYLLLMDADMELVVRDPDFKRDLDADKYEVAQGQGLVYYNIRLVRGTLQLEYKGVTHEFLNTPEPHLVTRRLASLHFLDHGDGQNRADKLSRDIALLIDGLQIETDPGMRQRYTFYLAQSYFDAGDYDRAIAWYQQRIDAGGWAEEVYYSLYRIGLAKKLSGAPWADVLEAFLECHRFRSTRLEPLYEIIFALRCQGRFEEAYSYANQALAIPYPADDVLFVSRDVYDFRLKDEVALCAFNIGLSAVACALWNEILMEAKHPREDGQRMADNLAASLARVQAAIGEVGKPLLCFYVGYTADLAPTEAASPPLYGSELAVVRLAEQLARFYEVYVFGTSLSELDRNTVHYRHSNGLHDFQKVNRIDVMIVSRYVHYFLEFTNRAAKTFLWLHDVLAQPSWQFKALPGDAKHLIDNMMPGIDGVIALSDWHRGFVLQHYEVDPAKIFVIGNAVDASLFASDHAPERVRHRFIYTSAPNRGLDNLIAYFHEIRKRIGDATLHIYRGQEDFSAAMLDEIEACGYIHYAGPMDSAAIAREFMRSEAWFYPTNWLETYCMSALEAQMAGCVCIATDVGALRTTVGDRGILLHESPYSEDFKREAIGAVVDVLLDEGRKADYQSRGPEWAKRQSWQARAFEWLRVLGYDGDLERRKSGVARQRMTVKLLANFASSRELCATWSKMCRSKHTWGSIEITDQETADYYCIVNHPRAGDFYEPEHTIVLRMEEAEASRPYFPPEWVDIDHGKYLCVFDERNSLEWHLNKTHAELSTLEIRKTKTLSTVTSGEYRHEGHIKRIGLLKYLEEKGVAYDLYGRENPWNLKRYVKALPYHQKDEGLFPYKYTIAAESVSARGYFTEKIVDAILSECLCFYWGCPNLEDYLDPRAFVRLDLEDFDRSLSIIEEAIASDQWEKRIDIIRQEKSRLLNEMQVMPVLERIITQSRTPPDYANNRLSEFHEYKEKHRHFHGDAYLMTFLERIVATCHAFVETGTYRGSSSRYVADRFPDVAVFTCESDPISYEKSVQNVTGQKNVCSDVTTFNNLTLYHRSSLEMLNELLGPDARIDRRAPLAFWLDAHSWAASPLADELSLILANAPNGYVFIDDFKNPRHVDAFQYNRFDGFEQSLEALGPVLADWPELNCYFPDYTSRTSTYHPLVGWVLMTNAVIDPEVLSAFHLYRHSAPPPPQGRVDIRVINLARRADRWARFCKEAGDAQLPEYRRFEAVDGQTLELSAAIEALFQVDDPANFVGKRVPRHHNFNAAVIGCALSHYSLWRELERDPERAEYDCLLVVEDDAKFVSGFAARWKSIYDTIEPDARWDLIYLGFNDDRGELYGDFQVHENVHRFAPMASRWHGGGTYAYCIRKKAAARLVALAETLKIQQPIDHWMIDQFDRLCVYKTVPYLVTADNHVENPSVDTDIQFTTRVLKQI